MMTKRWLACVLAVLACLAPAIARAQTTGSISGVVFDQGGQLTPFPCCSLATTHWR
jgi:hypothetical protein